MDKIEEEMDKEDTKVMGAKFRGLPAAMKAAKESKFTPKDAVAQTKAKADTEAVETKLSIQEEEIEAAILGRAGGQRV